ncbi:MAG: ABC transporter permease [Gammaproteobacteria bacterium]
MGIVRGSVSVILLVLFWQGVVAFFHLPNFILPSPWLVYEALVHHAHLIFSQSLVTMLEMFVGLVVGIVLGVTAAIVILLFEPLKSWLLPVLLISQAIPTFAIAPLLVLWFGFGVASKIVCVALMTFFPITSNFFDGLRETPQAYLDLSVINRASRWREFLLLRLPAARQKFLSGLRIAVVIAPIGAVVSEWVGASSGLGYLMLQSNARMQVDLMFAALLVLVVITVALYFLVDCLE